MEKRLLDLKGELLKFSGSYEELLELAVVLYAHRLYRQIILSLGVTPKAEPLVVVDDTTILTSYRKILADVEASPENYHRHERCLFYLKELKKLNPQKDQIIEETTELKLIWVALEAKIKS